MGSKYATHCRTGGHEFTNENTWRNKHGHRRCRKCHNEKEKVRYANIDVVVLYAKERAMKHYTKHKERINATQKTKDRTWDYLQTTLSRYKITLDQYHAIQESQDFCCAICKTDGKLFVDHNHKSGKVRSLLCHGCNSGIGLFRESPGILIAAAKYCENHYVAQ